MILLPLLLSLAPTAPVAQLPADPLRIYLRAGPKTHGPGEHDHPLFLKEWSVLLAERGAQVNGSLHFPSAQELAQTDVLVLYAAEGGTLDAGQRADLDGYLARGGGIVALHDSVCGNDAHWFKTIIGGAWEHGHSKWHTGKIGLYMELAEHPITRGIPHFDLTDGIYHDLHVDGGVQVLANSIHTPFDVTPQLWTLERDNYRAFVSLQGHYHETFSHPAWQAILLRGIAWAGQREADLFLTDAELGSLRYPPGGPTRPDEALDTFELHPDFTLQCVASEPDVVNPISIDWDNRGRMWVACTPGYPYKEKFSGIPAHDQILILEDTNGDGDATNDDSDGDGICDGADVCAGFDDLQDGDGDGLPDGSDACPVDPTNDTDGDTVCDGVDICPGGDDLVDTDGDLVPDDCDVCPGFDDTLDADADGVPDGRDFCPGFPDPLAGDGAGVPHARDLGPQPRYWGQRAKIVDPRNRGQKHRRQQNDPDFQLHRHRRNIRPGADQDGDDRQSAAARHWRCMA